MISQRNRKLTVAVLQEHDQHLRPLTAPSASRFIQIGVPQNSINSINHSAKQSSFRSQNGLTKSDKDIIRQITSANQEDNKSRTQHGCIVNPITKRQYSKSALTRLPLATAPNTSNEQSIGLRKQHLDSNSKIKPHHRRVEGAFTRVVNKSTTQKNYVFQATDSSEGRNNTTHKKKYRHNAQKPSPNTYGHNQNNLYHGVADRCIVMPTLDRCSEASSEKMSLPPKSRNATVATPRSKSSDTHQTYLQPFPSQRGSSLSGKSQNSTSDDDMYYMDRYLSQLHVLQTPSDGSTINNDGVDHHPDDSQIVRNEKPPRLLFLDEYGNLNQKLFSELSNPSTSIPQCIISKDEVKDAWSLDPVQDNPEDLTIGDYGAVTTVKGMTGLKDASLSTINSVSSFNAPKFGIRKSSHVGLHKELTDSDPIVSSRGKHSKHLSERRLEALLAKPNKVKKPRATTAQVPSGTKQQVPSVTHNEADPIITQFDWARWRKTRNNRQAPKQTMMAVDPTKVRHCLVRCLTMLRATIRIFQSIVKRSMGMTIRSATELQWYTLHGSKEAKALAFNKSKFARQTVQTKLPHWAIVILGKAPANRTEKDCRRLHALLRGHKSFDKFTERIQLAMCRSCTYDCISSMRVVVRKGHVGLNFYFIYSGSVFVNVEERDSAGTKFVMTEVILSRGESFGEIALLQETQRTATVSVRETCELLVVDRDVFAKICPQIFDYELEEKVDFLCKLPVFQAPGWNADSLRTLCFQAQIQQIKANKIIVADSTTDDWMYICMEGKCQVVRYLPLGELMMTSSRDSLTTHASTTVNSFPNVVLELMKAHKIQKPDEKESPLRRSSMIECPAKDKIRLLRSMALEYLKWTKGSVPQVFCTGITKDSPVEEAQHIPDTLTSLITQTVKENNRDDYVFLDVGNLGPKQIFDIQGILNKSSSSGSKQILVSLGSTMLKIKKSDFFANADTDDIEHAKSVSAKETFPSDTMLMNSYKNKMKWDKYKHHVISELLIPKYPDGALPVISPYSVNHKGKPRSALPGLRRQDVDTKLMSSDAWNRLEWLYKLSFEQVNKDSLHKNTELPLPMEV